MNKAHYLSALAKELQGLTEAERQEALFYYEQYFEDAGIDKEEEVIKELGDPKELAQKILNAVPGVPVPLYQREQNSKQNQAQNNGRFKGSGSFRSYDGSQTWQETSQDAGNTWKDDRKTSRERPVSDKDRNNDTSSSLAKILLVVALLFITAPLWISVGSVLLSLAAVLLLIVFLIPSCLTIVALVILAVGVYIFILGFFFPPIFFTSFALWGTGLFLTGLGIVATVGGVMIFIKTFPPLFRGIIAILRLPFHGRNKSKEHV